MKIGAGQRQLRRGSLEGIHWVAGAHAGAVAIDETHVAGTVVDAARVAAEVTRSREKDPLKRSSIAALTTMTRVEMKKEAGGSKVDS